MDVIATREGLTWQTDSKANADICTWQRRGRKILLVKPLTFMNCSGMALGHLARYYKWQPEQFLVAYDELQVPLGQLKISLRGSAGGHNGVDSLLTSLGNGFIRYRLGIGPKSPPQIDMKDFVLGKFRSEETSTLSQSVPEFIAGIEMILDRGVSLAMNHLNQKPKPNESDPDPTQIPG